LPYYGLFLRAGSGAGGESLKSIEEGVNALGHPRRETRFTRRARAIDFVSQGGLQHLPAQLLCLERVMPRPFAGNLGVEKLVSHLPQRDRFQSGVLPAWCG